MLTDKHIDLIGSQWHLNLLTGQDREDVHAFARAIYAQALEDAAHASAAWKPIVTAPTDGRWLLLAGRTSRTGAMCMVCRWDGIDWESSDDGYHAYIHPTHWMPLPPPPKGDSDA